ncbi:MAG: pantetheine-phosphate adenylyltransferase [Clostridia bacterium]|nr:pantetheine-phosphate adenylyltransferase [Clostridia bacterium]
MRIALIPGSFDPITLGHVNIIERAAKMFDTVYVAVMVNDSAKYAEGLSSKSYMFDMEQRLEMVRLSVAHIANVKAIARCGMLIDLCDELNVTAIVKGVRSEADFAYEMIHAKWNREHNERAETLLLPADERYGAVSSTLVRQLLCDGQYDSLQGVVSDRVIEWLKKGEKIQ